MDTFVKDLSNFTAEVNRRNLRSDIALPPFYRVLLAMGLRVKPPAFWPLGTMCIFFTVVMALVSPIFGLLSWLMSEPGHVQNPLFWPCIIIGGWALGHITAFAYWLKVRKTELPRWGSRLIYR